MMCVQALMATCMLSAGAPTVNRKFGTKVAVLVGDFLFAQSSWFLAKLDNLEVTCHWHIPSLAPPHERWCKSNKYQKCCMA